METESETKRRFATQLPANLISNIALFLVHVGVGILLVPFFISTLGVAAYGLIPLTSAITGYIALVVQSLNTTVSRFLTIDLQKNDFSAANKTFNTAFFGLAGIIALLIPVVLIGAYFIPVIFNIPSGQEVNASILFLCAVAAFFIRSLNGTLTVQLFAYNRLDLSNLVNITNYLVQVGLIVFLFLWKGPSLIFVGIGYVGGALVASVIASILAKRVCPHLFLSLHCFDRSRVRNLGEMGGWMFIDQVGTLFLLQMDLVLVNMIFGSTAAGEYAIVLTLGTQMRSIADVLAGVLSPMILTFYAKEHINAMIQVSKSAVKLMGLAVALPIGLICGFAPQLLTVWVGEQYIFLAPLLVIMTFHLVVNLAIYPLFSIIIAYNRMNVHGSVTVFMGICNLVLAVILSLYSGLGYYGIALAGVIILTLRNAVFTPWFAAKILGKNSGVFIKEIIPAIVAGIALGLVSFGLGVFFSLNSLITLTIVCGILSIIYILFIWKVGLSAKERNLFGSYLPEKIRILVF